jgi:hypothetical protein
VDALILAHVSSTALLISSGVGFMFWFGNRQAPLHNSALIYGSVRCRLELAGLRAGPAGKCSFDLLPHELDAGLVRGFRHGFLGCCRWASGCIGCFGSPSPHPVPSTRGHATITLSPIITIESGFGAFRWQQPGILSAGLDTTKYWQSRHCIIGMVN